MANIRNCVTLRLMKLFWKWGAGLCWMRNQVAFTKFSYFRVRNSTLCWQNFG